MVLVFGVVMSASSRTACGNISLCMNMKAVQANLVIDVEASEINPHCYKTFILKVTGALFLHIFPLGINN